MQELQKSFIGHATEVMQKYTGESERETMRRGKPKKAGSQVAPLLVRKKSVFNCASSKL